MSSTTTKYDALIIGSGQAGTPLSVAFAKSGKKTALIESVHIGGCCVNEGCTPTKTMIASGRVAYLMRRGIEYGISGLADAQGSHGENGVVVDMARVRQRKREIVNSFRGGNEKRVKDAGVDIFMGKGSFIDSKTVKVQMNDGTERVVEGERIFVNVGERPAPPDLEGLDGIERTRVLDSTSIQELDVVPEHLVIIGGGYVGVEFAQLFSRLGARVTVVQRGKQLLLREDREVAKCLRHILEEDGVVFKLESMATSIASSTTEAFELKVQTKDSQETILGSHILFAAGRIPNTETLNLGKAGISTNSRGHILTDEFLETSAPGIYGLGDVTGPPAFTHASYDDFRIIQKNLITAPEAAVKSSTKDRVVPYVVYTDPQLGHIGLHEHEARSKYPEKTIKTAKMPMSYVARALETDESGGMMKAVIDGETSQILGFTCLGIEGGEVMSIVQMAMMGGVSYEKLRDAIWAHPALAESLNNIWGFLE